MQPKECMLAAGLEIKKRTLALRRPTGCYCNPVLGAGSVPSSLLKTPRRTESMSNCLFASSVYFWKPLATNVCECTDALSTLQIN